MTDKEMTTAEIIRQLEIQNKLLIITIKVLLEAHQGQIEDADWHKFDDKIKELKKEI